MNNYKTLKAWQSSIELVVDIYKITASFPNKEMYGLTSQINRSAVSIPSNIAEGCGRTTSKDFNHFLTIALGSTCELETQLIIAFRIGYMNEEPFNISCEKIYAIQRMIKSLKAYNSSIKPKGSEPKD
jgi:four helix bundle protein